MDAALALRVAEQVRDAPSTLVRRFGSTLDAIGEVLARPAAALRPGPLKDLLSGTWLGHPLHPMLTDVTVGAWTLAGVLDAAGRRPQTRAAADTLVGLGVLSALPTATTGWSDWADLTDDERRLGVAHAMGNVTATTLYAASWLARRRGHRATGVALGLVGAGVASVAGYLGGHLVYARGVGVDVTVFDELPERYTATVEVDSLEEGKPALASVEGTPVFLCRRGRTVAALHDRCTHLGGPLHEGTVEDESVVCPWHGSRFRMRDGAIERGPARAPQPVLRSRVRQGTVEVARPSDG